MMKHFQVVTVLIVVVAAACLQKNLVDSCSLALALLLNLHASTLASKPRFVHAVKPPMTLLK